MSTAISVQFPHTFPATGRSSKATSGYHQPSTRKDMAYVPDGVTNPALESTIDLLARARQGEERAVGQLFERCLPALRRWARGRLPHYARDLSDTQDLVQETILHTLHRLDSFEPRHQGALQAYLRQAVANRIRDEIRRVVRRPIAVELDEAQPDVAPSPLEHAIGRQGVERYEAALQRLRPRDREAIIARVELQQSYEEVAVALGKPNANAARVAVTRALAKLIAEMDLER
jgi:RNA polymerase sigma-70 factor (ECF subfamily)